MASDIVQIILVILAGWFAYRLVDGIREYKIYLRTLRRIREKDKD